MNTHWWGEWIREGLELEPTGEAITVLLEQDSRKVYDKNKLGKVGRSYGRRQAG